jgi:CRP-like cAMP-binding protein
VQRDQAHADTVRRRELTRRLHALANVPPFAALPEEIKSDIAERLQYAPFARGDVMTKQGNKAHWLYILAYGEAEVLYEPPGGPPQAIGAVHAGQFFGEMALITGDARAATVVAKTDVECYRLDRASFQELLLARPEIENEIRRVIGGRRGDLDRARQAFPGAPAPTEAEPRLSARIRRFFGMGS